MAIETCRATFNETTRADADAAVDAYIDAIWTAVGGTPTYIEIDLSANINATDGNTGTYIYKMRITANNENSTLLEAALADLFTEFGELCTLSSLYDTIATIDGSASIAVTY